MDWDLELNCGVYIVLIQNDACYFSQFQVCEIIVFVYVRIRDIIKNMISITWNIEKMIIDVLHINENVYNEVSKLSFLGCLQGILTRRPSNEYNEPVFFFVYNGEKLS